MANFDSHNFLTALADYSFPTDFGGYDDGPDKLLDPSGKELTKGSGYSAVPDYSLSQLDEGMYGHLRTQAADPFLADVPLAPPIANFHSGRVLDPRFMNLDTKNLPKNM